MSACGAFYGLKCASLCFAQRPVLVRDKWMFRLTAHVVAGAPGCYCRPTSSLLQMDKDSFVVAWVPHLSEPIVVSLVVLDGCQGGEHVLASTV